MHVVDQVKIQTARKNALFWSTPLLSEDVWDKYIISLGLVIIGHLISLTILTSASNNVWAQEIP